MESVDLLVVELKNFDLSDKKHYLRIVTSFSTQQLKSKPIEKSKIGQSFTILFPKDIPDNSVITIKLMRKKSWPHQDACIGECNLSTKKLKDGDLTVDVEDGSKKVCKLDLTLKCKGNAGEGASEETFEDKYEKGKEIGRGAFSIVYKGIRKSDNSEIAIKVVNKVGQSADVIKLLRREISVMKKLQHPGIVSLYDVFEDDSSITMVLEYINGGELYDQIIDRGSFSEKDAISTVRQLLNALAYMHSNGVAHRDLKPENLLCASDSQTVKIADFGLSKDFSTASVMQTCCGSPSYVAPEVLGGGVYDTACDIWSLGVITYVLLSGFLPFFADTQQELFDRIMDGQFEFDQDVWDDVSDEAKDFVTQCLTLEPSERPSAATLLKHPWIASSTARTHKLNARASMANLNSGFHPRVRGKN